MVVARLREGVDPLKGFDSQPLMPTIQQWVGEKVVASLVEHADLRLVPLPSRNGRKRRRHRKHT